MHTLLETEVVYLRILESFNSTCASRATKTNGLLHKNNMFSNRNLASFLYTKKVSLLAYEDDVPRAQEELLLVQEELSQNSFYLYKKTFRKCVLSTKMY